VAGLCVVALFHTFNLQSYFDNLRLLNLASSREYSVEWHSCSAKVRLLHPRFYGFIISNPLGFVNTFFLFFLRDEAYQKAVSV
jgi:hypothetical protein